MTTMTATMTDGTSVEITIVNTICLHEGDRFITPADVAERGIDPANIRTVVHQYQGGLAAKLNYSLPDGWYIESIQDPETRFFRIDPA